jgi:hypothetical protein
MRKKALLLSISWSMFMLANLGCTPAGTDSTPQAPPPAASSAQVHGNLAQVMRGILFPNSNVIFAAQSPDFTKVKPAGDPATATDPIMSTYGGWMAVENSGLAIAESANLLTLPGRTCQNGKPVPMNNPDWAEFVQGLRDAGMAAYKAAQSKNTDNILMAADTMTTACGKCHEKYRDKASDADRCM